MITIYHNPRCGKSRAALEAIKASQQPYQVVEYLKETPSVAELTHLLTQLGMSPVEIIRTKEPIFIERFIEKVYSDAEWVEILHQYPILIERPIVVRDACAVIARTDTAVAQILE